MFFFKFSKSKKNFILIFFFLLQIIWNVEKNNLAILTLPPHRPPTPYRFWSPPKIGFLNVSDDFEQKKKNYIIIIFFWTFHPAWLELKKRLANLVPPRRVRIVRLGSSVNPKVKNDLQTSFRPAGLEIQKRLANLVPPSRVRIVRLGNTVRFVSKPDIQVS